MYRVGYEAIRNAYPHSEASELRIELTYRRRFQLVVRDNGCGINEGILVKGKPGHFGLAGMGERASSVGGKLSIASSGARGTIISLAVPGRVIFKRNSLPIWSRVRIFFADPDKL